MPTAEEFELQAQQQESTFSDPTNDLFADQNSFDDVTVQKPLGQTPSKHKKAKPQRPKTWRAFGGMVLGVVLMLAVLPTSIVAFFVAGQMVASNSWPSVEGRVLSSHVQMVGFGKKKKYRADIRYNYEVAGQWHTGSRVRLGDATGNSESAQQAIVDEYPAGSNVQVYYDPNWPDQSVLEPGGVPWTMALPPLLLGGIGWLFFGASTGRIKT